MVKSHLIIVPCHAIWKIDQGLEPENFGQSFKQWHLAAFQLEGRDHLSFIMHSLLALDRLLDSTSTSLLLFSGSCTKKEAGPVTEAQSYFLLARKLLNAVTNGFELPLALSSHKDIARYCSRISHKMNCQKLTVDELFAKHVSTEDFALDSLDNLFYSLLRFHEITSSHATQMTIAGFGFKRRRFMELHAAAIDYPANRISYLSYEPQPVYTDIQQHSTYKEELEHQETKNALNLFSVDWYASKDPLSSKKLKRNPFQIYPGYALPYNVTHPIEDDHAFFKSMVENKMPWSVGSQI
ncbi:LADA_0C07206g1_1 [Lachancea dasiensis]|uniref:LADA_0C07206g1_1 n=1 Tax=Lachancea dasiensis TaxID=1072105 RepID=A0A1G4IZF7_9SACH|nr:LADA_0C07206g1_1 [Lachancea dasiensis]